MAENIANYVRTERRNFAGQGVTDVDLLVFSAALYLEFERFSVFSEPGASTPFGGLTQWGELMQYAEHDYDPAGMVELAQAMADSARFAPVAVERFECLVGGDPAIQFAAACFPVTGDDVVVAFRGTDAKLVGWQEDFEMLWREAAPGQLQALRYLHEAARAYPGARLHVCGHSKGGSCAEYAALFADDALAVRIAQTCSFDGMALFKVGGAADADLEAYDCALLERYDEAMAPITRYVFPSSVGLVMERRDPAFLLESPGFAFVQSIDPQHEHSVCSVRVVDGHMVSEHADEGRIRKGTGLARIAPRFTGSERRFATDFIVGACREAGITVNLTDEGVKDLLAALRAHYRAASRETKRTARRLMAKAALPVF